VNYLSVCSGIEAATQAWHPLGWQPVAFSEINPFACAVLAHHYPNVPNWGDMTMFTEWPDADVDVLVGGTPCQPFSIAGLRAGLADPRGNLMLTYLAIAKRRRPRWIVWENVPGVLSSNGGRDFGTFLGGLGQLGYGFAYRVLDAQYVRTRGHPWAVPQRRRRVFVVGYLGDWRRAAAVFIDREGLRGTPPPRRRAGQGVANDVAARTAGGGGLGTDFDLDGGLIHCPPVVPQAMSSKWSKGSSGPAGDEVANLIAIQERAVSENPDAGPQGAGFSADGASHTLEARNKVQAVAFAQNQREEIRLMDAAGALAAEPGSHQQTFVADPVAFRTAGDGAVYDEGDVTAPLTTGTDQNAQIIAQRWRVRRLTPRECERLQGFPDDFTRIPYRGKPADKCPDGPRYKALGNSMAVNVMGWLGERIVAVEHVLQRANPK
jgi:DNA (cytosine-5)-methyltransferase 1